MDIGGLLKRLALGFSSTGFAVSLVLTVAHASNAPLPCGGGSGCDEVARDPSSYFLGMPVSAFGMAGYLALIVASLIAIRKGGRSPIQFGLAVSLLGTLVSAYLTYHSVANIHATCTWCLTSACMMASSLVSFGLLTRSKGDDSCKSGVVGLVPWILVPLVVVGSIRYFGDRSKREIAKQYKIDLSKVSFTDLRATSHSKGDPKARITIAEFGDLMCPACREMHGRVLTFLGKFPTKVNLMFHHFPMEGEKGHELSRYAADMSEQLSSSDFWGFVDQVYGADTKPDKAALEAMFKNFGDKWSHDAAGAHESVQKAIDLGKKYGVLFTPTYILFIDQKPDAFATSADLAKVLSRPEFAAIIAPKK